MKSITLPKERHSVDMDTYDPDGFAEPPKFLWSRATMETSDFEGATWPFLTLETNGQCEKRAI